jgi:hypothetical protein
MRILSNIKYAALALACATLTACFPTTESVATDVSRSSSKVIIVGSFEITPSIPQQLDTSRLIARPLTDSVFGSAEDLVGNRLVTGFIPAGREVRQSFFGSPLAGATHSVPLEELFFIEVDRQALELLPSKYFLSDAGVDLIELPGGFVTATHPTAQVVYVGNLRYRRDDFFAVTDIRVTDRYGEAVAAARRLYGPNITVAKALWRQ